MDNIVPINKPKGPTSHDIIDKIRKITGIKKVGHAGTLDPLAEGVLVVGIGRQGTKQLDTFVQGEKEYEAEITLGISSTTDDEEGEKTIHNINNQPTEAEIKKALTEFEGEIMQIPPLYSAIKIGGKKAYEQARKGKPIHLKPRKVTINKIVFLEYKYPELKIKITSQKGVYIRSLARDIGKELGIGAYLSDLTRTRVADFHIEESQSIEEFRKNWNKED